MKNWKELQFRFLFHIVSGSTPSSGNSEFWDGEIPWVTPEDVSSLDSIFLLDTRRKISNEGYKNSGTTLVPKNSIVLTKRAPIGQLAVLGIMACCNQGCFLLTAKDGVDPLFYYFFLYSKKDILQILGRGSTFMELSLDDLKSLKVPLPPLLTQRKIAAYLDRETAQIDALIVAKERLLELLAEKRQALITHAVTRGLDDHVKLKDSGVDWLGKVPEGWDVVQLKRALSLIEYGISTKVDVEGQIAVLRMGDIKNGEIDYSKVGFIDSEEQVPLLEEGDLVFNRTNSLDQIGKVAIYRKREYEEVSFASYLVRLRCNEKAVPEYMNMLLNSAYVQAWGKSEAIPAIGQANLNPNRYAYLPIALPPELVQEKIIMNIQKQTSRLDSLSQATEQTIQLLKERRTALIAAAVSGKIELSES